MDLPRRARRAVRAIADYLGRVREEIVFVFEPGMRKVTIAFLVLAMVPGIAGGRLLWHGIDGLLAQLSGVAGTVTVTTCEPETKYGFACKGNFVADDRTVKIAGVTLHPSLPEIPDQPIPAQVSGPDATTARPSAGDAWMVQLGGGAVFAGLAWWLLSWLLSAVFLHGPEKPSPTWEQRAAVERARAHAQRTLRTSRRRRRKS